MKTGKPIIYVPAVLMSMLLVGSAQALDVGLDVQRDVLYKTTFDSVAVPTNALVSVGLKLDGSFWLRVRAGYSSYYNWYSPIDGFPTERRSDGIRTQLIPTAVIPSPLEQVSFLVGVVIGGRWQSDRERNWRLLYEGYRDEEQSIWAIDQAFMAGLGFDLSGRFSFEIQAERQGLCLHHLFVREYEAWRSDYRVPTWSDESYRITWVNSARTGLGFGLRVKL